MVQFCIFCWHFTSLCRVWRCLCWIWTIWREPPMQLRWVSVVYCHSCMFHTFWSTGIDLVHWRMNYRILWTEVSGENIHFPQAQIQWFSFKGIKLTGSNSCYVHYEERITFYTKAYLKVIGVSCVTSLCPTFIHVAYDLSVGQYSVKSWIFLFEFW